MTKSKPYSFPSFYACYLLKSSRSLRTYRNYIGSSPDPVRRLRQHNGIVTGGARKTAAGRPWIMQLLVHGFPSRPAATSFEYAWQRPHRSRFLRDQAGKPIFEKRGTRLEHNILALQRMIQTHPFSTWPLHVKLFTEEAVRYWGALVANTSLISVHSQHDHDLLGHNSDGKNHAIGNEFMKEKEHHRQLYHCLLFPPGFTCSIELEGVDGSSGLQGSGREGPISVTDEQFTLPYLAKNTALIAATEGSRCSICAKSIHDFPDNYLGTTLCTHTACTSVAHLACLAGSWLANERDDLHPPSFQQLRPASTYFSSPCLPTSASPYSSSPPACYATSPNPLGHLPASACTPSSLSPLSSGSLSSSSLPSASPTSPHSAPSSPGPSTAFLDLLPSSLIETPVSAVIKVKPYTNGINSHGYNDNVNTSLPNVNPGPHSPPTSSSPPPAVPKAPEILANPFGLGKGMIPRGGICPSCGKYTLWGDIVRGCYRRHTGRVGGTDDNQDDESDDDDKLPVRAAKEAEGTQEQEELGRLSELVSDSGLDSGAMILAQQSKSQSLRKKGNTSPVATRQGRPAKAEQGRTKVKKQVEEIVGSAKVRGKTKRVTTSKSASTTGCAPPDICAKGGAARPLSLKENVSPKDVRRSQSAKMESGTTTPKKKAGATRSEAKRIMRKSTMITVSTPPDTRAKTAKPEPEPGCIVLRKRGRPRKRKAGEVE